MMATPLALYDDEWPHVGEAKTGSEQKQLPLKASASAAGEEAAPPPPAPPPLLLLLLRGDGGDVPDRADLSSGKSGAPGAAGELVDGFDGALSACFGDICARKESIAAAVGAITEEALLEEDEIWRALSSNYGNVMPVDWTESRSRSLRDPTRDLLEDQPENDVAAELSDDEELREQLDMHSIIVSSFADEPLFTAEQVIEEIEEMLQESPSLETEHHPSESDLSLDTQRSTNSDRVRTLSVAELNERLQQTELDVRRFSEELVQQLALRDELDFEKEVKNTFITALIDVQNRQKEQRSELLKKRRRVRGGGATTSQGHAERTLSSRFSMEGLSSIIQNSFRQTFGSGCSERQYLTTVIPYEKKGRPPSVEDLQILTKILQAMRDDSDKVPALLTDYILKVLCPT